jgi:hypothetical protein
VVIEDVLPARFDRMAFRGGDASRFCCIAQKATGYVLYPVRMASRRRSSDRLATDG